MKINLWGKKKKTFFIVEFERPLNFYYNKNPLTKWLLEIELFILLMIRTTPNKKSKIETEREEDGKEKEKGKVLSAMADQKAWSPDLDI